MEHLDQSKRPCASSSDGSSDDHDTHDGLPEPPSDCQWNVTQPRHQCSVFCQPFLYNLSFRCLIYLRMFQNIFTYCSHHLLTPLGTFLRARPPFSRAKFPVGMAKQTKLVESCWKKGNRKKLGTQVPFLEYKKVVYSNYFWPKFAPASKKWMSLPPNQCYPPLYWPEKNDIGNNAHERQDVPRDHSSMSAHASVAACRSNNTEKRRNQNYSPSQVRLMKAASMYSWFLVTIVLVAVAMSLWGVCASHGQYLVNEASEHKTNNSGAVEGRITKQMSW